MEASIKTLVVISLKFSETDIIKLLEFSLCLVDMFFNRQLAFRWVPTIHFLSYLFTRFLIGVNKTGAANEAGTSYPSS